MKLAVMLPVCESDGSIALMAVRSFKKAIGKIPFDLFVIDDGSASHVGESIRRYYEGEGGRCVLTRLPESLGYHHSLYRMWRQYADVLHTGVVYSHVLRFDSDALFLTTDLGDFLADHCRDVGMYGSVLKTRMRDGMLLLGDLIPGFRRREQGGRVNHGWEFGRLRPAWHASYMLRSLLRPTRFRFCSGSFLLTSWQIIKELGDRKVFEIDVDRRRGLAFGDDLLMSVCVAGLGYPLFNFRDVSDRWGYDSVSPELVDVIERARPYYIHPVKNTPAGIALRAWAEGRPWASACR